AVLYGANEKLIAAGRRREERQIVRRRFPVPRPLVSVDARRKAGVCHIHGSVGGRRRTGIVVVSLAIGRQWTSGGDPLNFDASFQSLDHGAVRPLVKGQ